VLIRPPSTRVGPLTPEERRTLLQYDAVGSRYDEALDRESAAEILAGKAGEAAASAAAAKASTAQAKEEALRQKEEARAAREQAQADAREARERARIEKERAQAEARIEKERAQAEARARREAARPTTTDKIIQSATRAAASSVGRQLGNSLLRGILGGFLRR
jgi:hypothetical protein